MNNTSISLKSENGVATITLNRPDVLNSFNRPMAEEMQKVLAGVAEDQGIRAVLLTGAGRGFCAGQDLAEVVDGGDAYDLGKTVRECYNPIIKAIRNIEKPVVCAVNGVAAGAGANLALACDIVVASDKSSFIQAFSKVGLIPDSGGTYFLPRLIGVQRAAALMMLADKVSAQEARDMGMIYKVFPAETLIEESVKMAEYLATQPTRSFAFIKRGLNRSYMNNLDQQLDMEEQLQQEASQTKDYKEGVTAFVEKRQPKFVGQ